mmetsp:Transcript_4920/g.12740  ORF Transcript_4920/g.12740 Transcript_4920/m.12740 type:complete len:603 (+) Transcript_4920:145-1953(+)|eukprot:CAMPEP_0182920458 /NCGR_PEP_ID=MMETSP0105_2-20130417/3473_1 /TAXON_ID=81532 ORGANISM="Acanthoeca-like sp., Strain 10tr" /NCGR_SAMPLE_ID=MMETSP0105_2 /ASSEMBLY_ACC=CAM_ASM_000205 /LENGTH=602 /DNA_ID=CAMNT_0025057853 /DNA_START=141 /DNA_END=1949 /DNA_ORIENTATION=-
MAENDKEYPEYQTAFLIIALLLILVVGAWLYWLTSEAYKIRQMQIKLGYKVPTIRSYFAWLFICCVGPLVRRQWEKENVNFRTDDYAPLKKRRPQLKAFLNDGGEWTKLPRGDRSRGRNVIKAAMAKIRANVIHDVLDEALTLALKDFSDSAQESREQERAAERMRAIAARWKDNVDHKTQRHAELTKMIASYEAEDSSEDEGASESGAQWDMGCEVSFMKMMPRDRRRRPSKRTARLPSDPHFNQRPRVQPATFGDWSEPGSSKAAAAPSGILHKPAPMTHGNWGAGAKGGAAGSKGPSVARVEGSRPIALNELKRFTRKMTLETIRPEFESIALNSPKRKTLNPAVHGLTANLDIFPFPHSRVKFDGGTYINASFIRGADGFPSKYIATQLPVAPGTAGFGKLPSVNAFWEMVNEHRCLALVVLDAEAAPFWPVELEKPAAFGAIDITTLEVSTHDDYTTTAVRLNKGGADFYTTVFEFRRWDDSFSSEGISAIIELSNAVRKIAEGAPPGPIVFLDADGGDRVGTMIAAEHCFQQIRSADFVDVVRAVANVREDRGGLVSTLQLYAAIYRLATVYLLGMGVSLNRAKGPPAYDGGPPQY